MTTANATALRSRYVGDAVRTASPARLVTMLYDRLVRDLAGAEQALVERRHEAASEGMVHAQSILLELRACLDTSKWDAAAGLAELYDFLVLELVRANVTKDVEKVSACKGMLEPLRDAWHQAARELG